MALTIFNLQNVYYYLLIFDILRIRHLQNQTVKVAFVALQIMGVFAQNISKYLGFIPDLKIFCLGNFIFVWDIFSWDNLM